MPQPPLVNMRVLDGRLGSKLPDMTSTDLVVAETMSMENLVAAIHDRVKGKRAQRLTVICHGFGEMVYGDTAVSTGKTVALPGVRQSTRSAMVCKIYGGYGLELGKDNLTLQNASMFTQLRGWFSPEGVLEICGCAAADTGPTVSCEMSGDGPALMRALAAATGASVRAPIRLQTVKQNWYLGTADRTAFVGPTFLFGPNGQSQLEVASY